MKKSSKAAEINLQDVNWFVMCFAKKIIMKKKINRSSYSVIKVLARPRWRATEQQRLRVVGSCGGDSPQDRPRQVTDRAE